MMDDKILLLLLFTFNSTLLLLLSIPLIRHKIGRNGLYGVRIPQSFKSDENWYAINEFGGWRLLSAAVVMLSTSILFYFIPGLGLDAYALSCLAVLIIALGISLVQIIRYANNLKD